MTNDLFEFHHVSPTEPLNTDPFYQWLNENADRQNTNYHDEVTAYLAEKGFVVGTHRISEQAFEILKHVHETWVIHTPHFSPKRRAELFVEGRDFWLQGGDPDRTKITPLLAQMVAEAGWIYDVAPDTTYFSIVAGRLYAKYQQILGSRFICRLED